MDEATAKFQSTMDTLNSYVVENKIPKELKRRLLDYFYYQKELLRASHYTELLELMTPTLRGEVAVLANGKRCMLLRELCFILLKQEKKGTPQERKKRTKTHIFCTLCHFYLLLLFFKDHGLKRFRFLHQLVAQATKKMVLLHPLQCIYI